MENNIPKITTRETEHLRSLYPSLSHLEAGRVAEWLQERKDQLLEQALIAENEADAARVLGLVAAGVGTVCYAVNPFMLVGGMIGGAAWLWFVVDHYNRTKEIAPLPWVRGNFLDAIARVGDYDARQDYRINHLAETIKFLPRRDATEYAFLYSDYFETVIDYLTSVEPGKRFYAYRWLLGCFEKFSGRELPDKQSLNDHLENVVVDSRVKVDEVTAIQKTISTPKFVSLPKPNLISLPKPLGAELPQEQPASTELDAPLEQPAQPQEIPLEPPTETKEITFDKQIPNLPKLLASSLKLSLICGIPGCGKGVFISNALEEVRANLNRIVTIFYIDPKNDPKETAYFSGRVDYLFRKDLMTSDPQDAFEWVQECLNNYDQFDCEGGYKLLVFDELLLTLKTLQLVKGAVHWFKTKVTGYASSGDSRGIIFWGISQNAHVSGLGFDGGDRTMFIPVFIVDARNISASVGLLASKMIPSDQRLTSKQIQELCSKSVVGRAIYFGGINRWYPMPKLNNYSGFDRDTRTFLPGFAPPPKGEKLAVDYDAVNSLENTFKLDANKVPDVPEVEQVENVQDEKATSFDFNKGLEALRSAVGKDWMKFGEARSSLKPLRKVTRDVDDVKLLVNFLVREREAEIKDNEFFRIIKKPD